MSGPKQLPQCANWASTFPATGRRASTELTGQEFDYVLTICDNAKEVCPIFPGRTVMLHHSFDDPAALHGPEEERLTLFRRVRDELRTYLSGFARKEVPAGGDSD